MEINILKFLSTGICLTIMFVWFIYANKKFKNYVVKNPFGDYEQPRTASVLGVLGTFIGVAIGLLNFDPSPDEMQKSVINLLGGMTTAFFTSIVGMSISLYFRNYQANVQKKFFSQNPIKSDANISDLIQYLQASDKEKFILLEKLASSLIDDGDSTIIGQMKIIKSDIRDEFKNLEKILQANNDTVILELKNFGKMLAENNSKLLVEALNETVKDFNNKLTEQFGENFKQLNIAVGKLLEWQENYKVTLEVVTQNLQLTFEGIDAVKNSLVEIEKSAEAMTESSQQIQNLIITADFYENELKQVLQEIQILGKNSSAAVSEITNFVQTLCEETKTYTEQATQDVNAHTNLMTDNLNEKLQATLIKTNNMTATINNFGNTALNKISNTTAETINSMQQMSVELRRESFKITADTAKKLDEMMRSNDRNFKESLETLGKAMIQISKKFATDYEPLAEELRKIVEISKQVQQSSRGGSYH